MKEIRSPVDTKTRSQFCVHEFGFKRWDAPTEQLPGGERDYATNFFYVDALITKRHKRMFTAI